VSHVSPPSYLSSIQVVDARIFPCDVAHAFEVGALDEEAQGQGTSEHPDGLYLRLLVSASLKASLGAGRWESGRIPAQDATGPA
jgi:hypothetical protein